MSEHLLLSVEIGEKCYLSSSVYDLADMICKNIRTMLNGQSIVVSVHQPRILEVDIISAGWRCINYSCI